MSKLLFIILAVILVASVYLLIKSNKKSTQPIPEGIDQIKTKADISSHQGKFALVIGKYVEVDVRQKRPGDTSERLMGHAAIILEDSTQIFIYPPNHELAIRPVAERKKLKNKRVWIEGKIHELIPQGEAASIVAPYISDVTKADLYIN